MQPASLSVQGACVCPCARSALTWTFSRLFGRFTGVTWPLVWALVAPAAHCCRAHAGCGCGCVRLVYVVTFPYSALCRCLPLLHTIAGRVQVVVGLWDLRDLSLKAPYEGATPAAQHCRGLAGCDYVLQWRVPRPPLDIDTVCEGWDWSHDLAWILRAGFGAPICWPPGCMAVIVSRWARPVLLAGPGCHRVWVPWAHGRVLGQVELGLRSGTWASWKFLGQLEVLFEEWGVGAGVTLGVSQVPLQWSPLQRRLYDSASIFKYRLHATPCPIRDSLVQ
jgi:hypothetical protein